MDDERRTLLSVQDWGALGMRLTAHVKIRSEILGWRTGRTGLIAKGQTAEDVAYAAILKVFDGERVWDPSRGPLFRYLCGVADSLLSHLRESPDHRRRSDSIDRDDLSSSIEEVAPAGDQRVAALVAKLGRAGDDDLRALVDALFRGCDATPLALAAELQTTVSDVNNRLKRLRRIAAKTARPSGNSTSEIQFNGERTRS